jgi:hypothetical protein
LLLIIEGTTEMVSQFVMTLKSICNKNVYFVEQNVFLNTAERLKHSTFLKLTIFLFKKSSVCLYRAVL